LRAVPLVAREDSERAGFFGRVADTVRRWFQ
jgi:D-alanyl-D-alanine carboxypeptidase (penicillin-binding protein 5/6)